MISCPKCSSKRIGKFRLDIDWGHGGDWCPANTTPDFKPSDDAGYTPLDVESFDGNERPDIECHVCCQCAACFDV